MSWPRSSGNNQGPWETGAPSILPCLDVALRRRGKALKMSTDNRTLRRKLDRELTNLEDQYLAMRDLKSDGALTGQSIPTILQYDDAVESIAAAMHHLREAIHQLDVQSELLIE